MARDFNGTDDYLVKTSPTDFTSGRDRVAWAWIYPTGWGEGDIGVIHHTLAPTAHQWYTINQSSEASFWARVDDGSTRLSKAANSTLSLDKWWFVAYWADASDTLNLYVGDLETEPAEVSYASQATYTGALGTAMGEDLYVGNQHTAAATFDGVISRSGIWEPNAPTEATVLAFLRDAWRDTVDESDSDLYAYWKLEGSDLTDSSSNSYDLTATGTTAVDGPTRLNLGRGRDFDGSDDRLEATAQYTAADDWLCCAWVKIDSWTDTGAGVWSRGTTPSRLWVRNDSGDRTVYVREELGGTHMDYKSAVGSIAAGSWYHIAGWYDHSTKDAKIWIGDETTAPTEPSYSETTTGSGSRVSSTAYAIGDRGDDATNVDGSISRVAVWEITNATEAECDALVENHWRGIVDLDHADLVGYWPLDSRDDTNTSNIEKDLSGNDYHMSTDSASTRPQPTIGPDMPSPPSIGARDFDGTDDVISKTSGVTGLDKDKARLMCVWAYPTAWPGGGGFGTIFGNHPGTPAAQDTWFYLRGVTAGPDYAWTIFIEASSSNGAITTSLNSAVLNKWQHVSATLPAGNGDLEMYLGDLATEPTIETSPQTDQTCTSPHTCPANIYVGNYGTATLYFPGYLAHFAIWEFASAPSQAEMETLIQKHWRGEIDTSDSDLYGYWPMNDGTIGETDIERDLGSNGYDLSAAAFANTPRPVAGPTLGHLRGTGSAI